MFRLVGLAAASKGLPQGLYQAGKDGYTARLSASRIYLFPRRPPQSKPLRYPPGSTQAAPAIALTSQDPRDRTTVRLKENEPFEVALRRFKRTVEKTGLLTELRAREFYEKPTSERKRKLAAAVKRHYKRLRSQMLPPKLY